MQDEDKELSNLSPEIVKKAIAAVQARAWDVNPFTVADELKVSKSDIYRQAEIMKLIIAARGGGFGMDMQTSLDLTWQLRQLELQNSELREKLASSESHKLASVSSAGEEAAINIAASEHKEADKPSEVIFNLANNGLKMDNYFNQLTKLSWKDIETVYYFKLVSLKNYAQDWIDTAGQLDKTNGSESNLTNADKSAISYDSLISMEVNKRQSQSSSISPFARLKVGSLGSNQISKEVDFEPKITEQPSKKKVNLEDLKTQSSSIELEQSNFVQEESVIIASIKEPEIKLIPLLKNQPESFGHNIDLIIDSADQMNKFVPSETESADIAYLKEQETHEGEPVSAEPRDELRDLIQSYIKNAAEQLAELPHGHSIGSGKEFEVWLNNPARSKFVGSVRGPEDIIEEEVKNQPKPFPFKPRVVPPHVRKACLILGVRPDNITFEAVQEAWKKAIAAPGVHPDLGGDTELAVYLNTAKDVLMCFLDAQAPKLGKKFGPFKTEKNNKTKTEKPKD